MIQTSEGFSALALNYLADLFVEYSGELPEATLFTKMFFCSQKSREFNTFPHV